MSRGGSSVFKKIALAKSKGENHGNDFQPSIKSVLLKLHQAKKHPKRVKEPEKKVQAIELQEEPEKRKLLDEAEIERIIEEKLKGMKAMPAGINEALAEKIGELIEKKEEKKGIAPQETTKNGGKNGPGIELEQEEEKKDIEVEKEEKKDVDVESINEVFPLITLKKGNQEQTYVWGNIRWVAEANALKYFVQEPTLSKKEKDVLDEIKNILERKLDVQFKSVKSESAFDYLRKNAETIQKKIGLKLSENQKMKFEYYLYRDFIGLGPIEPLMHDPNIEDVSCDGANISLFIYHRNPKYAGMETNVIFETGEELDSFVLKLSQKVGRSISIAEPLLDGALPDGSRVQATYGSDIARRGSNFTIRKFTNEPITPIKEIEFGTINADVLAFLWLAIENGLSILISGATATGKTSLLNAISLFIKPEAKIVSIEDTPELRLPQPNWVPQVARSGFGREAYGEVSMFDLLKASLRQRPDFVIVGEVRGNEANVMFQGMATGHAALGTLHADSFSAVYDRLTTRPIDLPASMLENLDLIVFLVLTKRGGAYIRKVKEVVEVLEYDLSTNQLRTNIAFRWDSMEDKFVSQKSVLLDKMREKMGISTEEIVTEFSNRVTVIRWLDEHKITKFEEFSTYIKRYYNNKKAVLQEIKGG